ncbi:MAG: GDSL-type esterase/lipase family protein [Actinomycetota bacterium]|nr:GDSL-type esterase/lipase family protein [Actinomycetota bacterium]
MSRRTYRVRRLVVLSLVLALGWGVVTLVSGVFGGDDAKEAAAVEPTMNTFISDGGPTTAPTLPPTTTTEPPVKEVTVPSAADPAEVLILGDSDAGTFGPYLKSLLDDTGIVTTELDYKTSSGLSRPDFFDWPAHMRSIVPQVNPDIVIATFGGNDAQGLRNIDESWAVPREPTADDAEWREEYGRRVGEVMDYLSDGNRTLIWVGIPNDDNPDVTARMQVQDEVVRAEAAERPDVVFIDTWARFSGRNGGWAEFVVDPRDGEGKDVRADDGFHLNENGAEILALDIADAVRLDLRARGAAI